MNSCDEIEGYECIPAKSCAGCAFDGPENFIKCYAANCFADQRKDNTDVIFVKCHNLFKTGDKSAPESIKDRNGDIVLALCKDCGKGEIELQGKCEK